MKIMLLGLLAMLALSSVAASTASAELQGPWWRHLNANNEQVLYPENEEKQIKSVNQSPFILKSSIGKEPITIECKSVASDGWIWNGAHQGEDQVKTAYGQCSVTSPVKCPATVGETKTYSELMWKYQGGGEKELNEAGQQKIYDVFAPETTTLKEEEPAGKGIFRGLFSVITLPKECGVFVGPHNVEAVGKKSPFITQQGVKREVVWGTAAFVAPQNYDLLVGELVWNDPNVTWLHHQGTIVTAQLQLGNAPAELQGQLGVRRQEEKFGAFNE